MDEAAGRKLLKARGTRRYVKQLAEHLGLKGQLQLLGYGLVEPVEVVADGCRVAPSVEAEVEHEGVWLNYRGEPPSAGELTSLLSTLAYALRHHLENGHTNAEISRHSLEKYRELSLLYKLGENLNDIATRQALIDVSIGLLAPRVRFDHFFAAMLEPITQRWQLLQPSAQESELDAGVMDFSRLSKLLAKNVPAIYNTAADSERLWRTGRVPMAATALIPLYSGRDLLGGLLFGRRDAASPFTTEELHLLMTFSFIFSGKLSGLNMLDRMLTEQERAYLEAMQSLNKALEAKDAYTARHSHRVAEFAGMLGKRVGLNAEELNTLRQGALMHDLGKIGIPDKILNKAGPLDDREYEVMRSHVVHTAAIMQPLKRITAFTEIASWHHERWDGSGYPDGLAGEEIPLPARIVAIADAWDAMTDDRVYRKGMPVMKALAIMERERDSGQWDPELLDVFIEMIHDLHEARAEVLFDMLGEPQPDLG